MQTALLKNACLIDGLADQPQTAISILVATEGFDTKDLQEAKTLLAELGH
jgi:hypothetical protein